jgi:hypothetical protein
MYLSKNNGEKVQAEDYAIRWYYFTGMLYLCRPDFLAYK